MYKLHRGQQHILPQHLNTTLQLQAQQQPTKQPLMQKITKPTAKKNSGFQFDPHYPQQKSICQFIRQVNNKIYQKIDTNNHHTPNMNNITIQFFFQFFSHSCFQKFFCKQHPTEIQQTHNNSQQLKTKYVQQLIYTVPK